MDEKPRTIDIDQTETELVVESTEVIEHMTVSEESVEQVEEGSVVVESLDDGQFIQPVNVIHQTADLAELANQHTVVEIEQQLYPQQSSNHTILSDVILQPQGEFV